MRRIVGRMQEKRTRNRQRIGRTAGETAPKERGRPGTEASATTPSEQRDGRPEPRPRKCQDKPVSSEACQMPSGFAKTARREMKSPQLFGRRCAPRNAFAKVTSFIPVVALRAERCALPLRPLLAWHIVNCETEIAESTCFDSAIHARTAEKTLTAESDDFHLTVSKGG